MYWEKTAYRSSAKYSSGKQSSLHPFLIGLCCCTVAGDFLLRLFFLCALLSEEDQDLYRLYYTEGYSQKEIAEMKGVSQNTVSKKLRRIKKQLTDAAYRKAFIAAESIESLFSISDKMLRVIAYIFEKLEEVTPLMLQKLLYFIQGVYSALYGRPIFEEDCRAWVYGPVYPEVYELFRDFKYNPIDDARFALLEGAEDALMDDEKRVIDLVVNTFGMYGGKVLERITHNEDPWMEARKGYGDSISSSELLPKERIMKYYILINQKYGIGTEDGLRTYIHDMLDKAS